MKNVVYLLIGLAVGAILALLFAPESGKDLRTNISGAGEADWQKMQSEWQTVMQDTSQHVATVQEELKQKGHSQSDAGDADAASDAASGAASDATS